VGSDKDIDVDVRVVAAAIKPEGEINQKISVKIFITDCR
jgi:transcriptional regulator with PAS, ATPase and Fis domain